MHNKSVLRELRDIANASATGKQQAAAEENFPDLDNHVNQFVALVYEAAKEGLWEIDWSFDSCTLPQLQRIAEAIKHELFDVMIITDAGCKKITASWHS